MAVNHFIHHMGILVSLLFLFPLISWGKTLDEPDDSLPIVNITGMVGFGQDTISRQDIDIIVVHTNYYADIDTFNTTGCILQLLRYDVAPHYMITRDNKILYMVNEDLIAWHAGKSRLPGTDRDSLNAFSIGIEIIAHPDAPPTRSQCDLLVRLICDIRKRHPIRYLMRHSDISPGRKTDPWNINWQEICECVERKCGKIIYIK